MSDLASAPCMHQLVQLQTMLVYTYSNMHRRPQLVLRDQPGLARSSKTGGLLARASKIDNLARASRADHLARASKLDTLARASRADNLVAMSRAHLTRMSRKVTGSNAEEVDIEEQEDEEAVDANHRVRSWLHASLAMVQQALVCGIDKTMASHWFHHCVGGWVGENTGAGLSGYHT